MLNWYLMNTKPALPCHALWSAFTDKACKDYISFQQHCIEFSLFIHYYSSYDNTFNASLIMSVVSALTILFSSKNIYICRRNVFFEFLAPTGGVYIFFSTFVSNINSPCSTMHRWISEFLCSGQELKKCWCLPICPSVHSVQVCLEQSIFIFFSQRSLREQSEQLENIQSIQLGIREQ